jgi:hypothetical protein
VDRPLARETSVIRPSSWRPGGQRIYAQELSYFLNNQHGRRGVNLDDLDDITDYFGVTIGELFDVPVRGLSADEQRLVLAFRALPPATQDHVLGVVEPLSVTQAVTFRRTADPLVTQLTDAITEADARLALPPATRERPRPAPRTVRRTR